ncbi:hypothetical protein ACSBR1_016046 [Camellia fascicularis]
MARATSRIPMSRRILMFDNYGSENSDESVTILAGTIFGFLDENSEEPVEGSTDSHDFGENEDINEDEEKENTGNVEVDKTFWETQQQLLHETLCRSSSLESRIRNATKEALKEVQMAEIFCACRKPATGGCRNCLMRKICCCLQTAGFDSTICKSKWKSSPHIPSGEHTFLDVVDNSSSKKGEVRVIIELNFRVEFEMARASEEYKKLITRLPEVFVGKVERLHNLIKILCSAAKKCMKDNKMHMGPWRKHKYMQAKWLSTCERTTSTPILSTRHSAHTPRPKASMLTVDLLENLSNLNRPTVQVV